MSMYFVILAVGVVLLVFGSNLLIKTAITLSHRFGISPLLTGITFVSIGTSLPELIVSVIALNRNDQGLAIGNIVGSNISNILLILSIGLFFSPLRIGTQKTIPSTLFMGLASVLFALTLGRVPAPFLGMILLFFAGVFTFWEYRKTVQTYTAPPANSGGFIYLELLNAVVAIIAVAVGGLLTVFSTQELSVVLGHSTTVLGLTLTAVATSLPELLATVMSQNLHEEKLALGNIIGSNIYNLLLIGGILALQPINPLPMLEVSFLMISTLLLVFTVVLFKGKNYPIAIGALQLGVYGVYILILSKHLI